jgi:hypothetical protein
MPPVRQHVATCIYHTGTFQEHPHTIVCDLVVPLLVAFSATQYYTGMGT